MSATALLTKTPKPTLEQVREALSGNICFCGDSTRQVNVVMKGI
jgi:aerobic-type carbon monoxide dehydrogenase small subunit (CoxS/CutS family)